jgi:hypothetical protein
VRVKFLKDSGPNRAGSEADLPDDRARQHVKAGEAVELPAQQQPQAGPTPPGQPPRAGEEPTMRVRFRTSATVAGVAYRATDLGVVPQSDEAWDAVDRGVCDLDPPPGVAGQPQVPERLARTEKTEAPAPPVVAGAAQTAALTPTTPQARRAAKQAEAQPATPETVGDDPHAQQPRGGKGK